MRAVETDIDLSEQEFDELRRIIRDQTGINMVPAKRKMVERRLNKILQRRGLDSFKSYCRYLQSADAVALEEFSNAVTTNLTSFFREEHHFKFLASTVLPEIQARPGAAGHRIRIWSAGCSTGEEPYSMAITLREELQRIAEWDAKILATDLDTNVLATASAGIYDFSRVETLAPARLKQRFKKGQTDKGVLVKVRDDLKSLISFQRLNLMGDWPPNGPFDIIFCRNVIIYFDKPTQKKLIDRYANCLVEGGYLILGHSESLFNVSERFTLLGQTIYRKDH